MAQMITIVGAMLGFMIAIVGFFVFEFSFLSAFAIWAASGPLSALVGFLAAGSQTAVVRKTADRAYDAAA